MSSIYPSSTENITGTAPVFLFQVSIGVQNERLSSHGGKRSLSSITREREQRDPTFKAKMMNGRKLLAEEIHDVDQEDSLVKRRLQQGYSQQYLATILGTSQSHIAKIEAGTLNINFTTATKLADALNTSMDDLRTLVEISKQPKPLVTASL